MDPNQIRPRASAKDVFLNLGGFIALYTLIGSLLNLLFSIIDSAYPRVINGYSYAGSSSISWPVSILVVLFPIFVLLMWFLERQYRTDPEMQNSVIHRGFVYITLFISGVVLAADLITVVYYFIDGQELTTGFLLKVVVLLVISSCVFLYFVSDLRGKLTRNSRIVWRFTAGSLIVVSVIWAFMVLGSPRTQRLYKYDEQKVNDLMNLSNQIVNFYSTKGMLPTTLSELTSNNYYVSVNDSQTQKPYAYQKTGETSFNLCAEFNKASTRNMNTSYASPYGEKSWVHPAGNHCFQEIVNPNTYYKPYPSR